MANIPGKWPELVAKAIRLALPNEPKTASDNLAAISPISRPGHDHFWRAGDFLGAAATNRVGPQAPRCIIKEPGVGYRLLGLG
jgi:hypothetical protein